MLIERSPRIGIALTLFLTRSGPQPSHEVETAPHPGDPQSLRCMRPAEVVAGARAQGSHLGPTEKTAPSNEKAGLRMAQPRSPDAVASALSAGVAQVLALS